MNTIQHSYSIRDFLFEAKFAFAGINAVYGTHDVFKERTDKIVGWRILSYIPVISLGTGLCNVFIGSAILHTIYSSGYEDRIDLIAKISSVVLFILRGLSEIIGIGIINVIPDIIFTAVDPRPFFIYNNDE